MNLKSILFTLLAAVLSFGASAQCSAFGYYSQSGSTVTFYDSSYSVNGHIVDWAFGDGSYGYGSTASHTYTTAGTYTAYLSIYDSLASCFDSTSFSITIGSSSSCNAAFTYSVDSSNALKLNFSNTSTSASTFYWWFGGSATSTLANPSYTFSQSGYHTVCLTTYDSSGTFCDSICSSVYVPGTPVSSSCDATFWASVSGNTAYFYDSLSTNYMFEYSYGDGSYGYSSSPSHTYSSAGTYTACLFVYDVTAAGDTLLCDSFCNTLTIAGSSSSCNAAFTYSVDSSNAYKLNFNNTSSNASSFGWWFGGSATSSLANPSYTFNQFGYHTVCLTTYDSSGNLCDTVCSSVYVPGTPSSSTCDASFWASVSGNTAYFYDSLSPNYIFEYSYGDGSYGYSSSPSHTYSAGTYTACLFVYDVTAAGDTVVCDSSCQTITIGSTSSCSASFYAYPDSINMSASSYPVYFFNNSTGVNYLWNFGDGNTDTSTNPTHTYTSAGTYTICLYVLSAYDSLGLPIICDSACTSVTVGNTVINCTPTMTYTIDSVNSNTYYFSGTTPPTGGYAIWSVFDSISGATYYGQFASHTYSSTSFRSVYYNVYRADSSWCGGTGDTFNISAPACQASYYLGLDTASLYNLYIINNSTGTSSSTNFYWSFGDGSSSTAQFPTHQYSTFGAYNLCLTISDSLTGCYSTYCDTIGLDSNGNLLKKDGFSITVVDERDLTNVPTITSIKDVNVYPNPSAGAYTIKLNLKMSEEIFITAINSLGQEIFNEKRNGISGINEFSMDMKDSPNGIYFLTIRAGEQAKNVKVYIQK